MFSDSPKISTPFLDQNADTPFSPFCDTFDLPHYADMNRDLSVESYLTNDWSCNTHPTYEFNGNPSDLLIDKSKTPQLPALDNEEPQKNQNEGLFPPLNDSQTFSDTPSQTETKEDLMYQEIADLGSPLSDNDNTSIESKPLSKRGRKKKTTAKKEAKLFSCPYCHHISKRRYNLGTHIKTHDKTRIKEFGCDECHKRFDRRHDRDRHLATVHHGQRSFGCKRCSLHFSRRDGLNRHLAQQHS
ncbi:hypothetical protein BY458DRAFT_504695 [Sporodiniella umbellata]|nr:hypothetical protein BY458DRAFT_504695 [Sporodiniella umbellata]